MQRLCRPAIVAVLAALPASALAGDTPTEVARRHQNAAFQHLQRGENASAVGELEAAYAAVADAGFLFNLALAYERWNGHCVEAIATWDRYLEGCPACAQAADARARKAAVAGTCLGELLIETDPAGAEVALDGAAAGTTPLRTRLPPGAHQVHVSSAGRVPEDRGVDLAPSATTKLILTLRTAPPVAAVTAPPPPLEPRSRGFRVAGFTGLGVGIAGLIAGTVFAVQTVNARSDFDRLKRTADPASTDPLRPRLDMLAGDAGSAGDRMYGGYAAGLVGLAFGALCFLLDEGE